MTLERSKRRDFLSLIFISKSISKKLLIKILTHVSYYLASDLLILFFSLAAFVITVGSLC